MAKGIAHREWAIHRSDYETDDDFRTAVENEAVLNVQIMERLGVAIISAPVRRQGPEGGWYTEAVFFQTATVPGVRDEPAVETEDEDEDEQEMPDLAAAVGMSE